MLKTIFMNLLKLSLAAALIGWLLSSGKLDFKLLGSLKNYPGSVALALFLNFINFWLISYRWKSILKARSQAEIPLAGIFKITWIGQFFSSVLPGSVSGDLIKILYVQKYEASFSKKFLLASILIDRCMGLAGLIFLVGLNSIFFSKHILSNAPGMESLLDFNYILVGIVILCLLVFAFCNRLIRELLVRLQSKLLPKIFEGLITLWDDLVMIKSKILQAVALSIVVQLFGVLMFWILISPFVGEKLDLLQALAFIPLGLMTLALPVAPSGLGVGHAIFQKLFEFSGIDNGASLFNLYFVLTLSFNILGVIPYLLSKRKQ